MLDETTIRTLIQAAMDTLPRSYAPYSRFHVAAALLAQNGQIFTGCNIENAAYSPTNCAERTAVFKAVSEGVREFSAIAIVGGPEGKPLVWCPPCGVCRQVLREFCDPERLTVILATDTEQYQTVTLAELLPRSFGAAQLQREPE